MGRQLPRGILIRDNRVWISFSYKGVQCRESLGVDPNIQNIRYAETKLQQIKLEIKLGDFDYRRHFPNSKRLKKFGLDHQVEKYQTVKDRLLSFMQRHEKDRVSHTTFAGYMKSVEGTLIPEFGDYLVMELKPSHIAHWVKRVSKRVTRKTVANHLLPLRNMYSEIETNENHPNPVKKVNLNLYYTQKLKAERELESKIDPFDDDEILELIESTSGQTQNLIQFWSFTGLRTGEVIALRWSKVNFKTKTVTIDRSVSLDIEGNTKTGETRTIDLLPPAIEALKRQRTLTGQNEFVFVDKNTRFKDDQAIRKKAWKPVFNNCSVRYRYPYQLRHTFAIKMLMAGEDERWVAKMLGHKSLEMLKKNYGNHLPNQFSLKGYKTKNDWDLARKKHDLKVVK